MKTFKTISIAGFAGLAIMLTISACQKEFNAKSYAPSKPLPTYGGYSKSADIEPASLQDYFNFNAGVKDSLGNLSGTTVGNITFGQGVSGKAYQGAASSYVVFPNAGPGKALQSYTLAFWMNSPKTAGLARGLFSFNNPTDFWGSLDVYLDNPQPADKNGDTLEFKVHMNNTSGVAYAAYFLDSRVPVINKWVHMAITYDASTSVLNIYENGTAIGIQGVAGTSGYVVGPTLPGSDPKNPPVTPYGPLKLPTTEAVLGTWQFQTSPSLTTSATAQSWAESFTGLLDNFRLYDKALSTTEIGALYNLEKQGR